MLLSTSLYSQDTVSINGTKIISGPEICLKVDNNTLYISIYGNCFPENHPAQSDFSVFLKMEDTTIVWAQNEPMFITDKGVGTTVMGLPKEEYKVIYQDGPNWFYGPVEDCSKRPWYPDMADPTSVNHFSDSISVGIEDTDMIITGAEPGMSLSFGKAFITEDPVQATFWYYETGWKTVMEGVDMEPCKEHTWVESNANYNSTDLNPGKSSFWKESFNMTEVCRVCKRCRQMETQLIFTGQGASPFVWDPGYKD